MSDFDKRFYLKYWALEPALHYLYLFLCYSLSVRVTDQRRKLIYPEITLVCTFKRITCRSTARYRKLPSFYVFCLQDAKKMSIFQINNALFKTWNITLYIMTIKLCLFGNALLIYFIQDHKATCPEIKIGLSSFNDDIVSLACWETSCFRVKKKTKNINRGL